MWALCGNSSLSDAYIKWYIARLVVKNEYEKGMRYNEIGQCAQNMDNVLGSVRNITFGRSYMIIQRER